MRLRAAFAVLCTTTLAFHAGSARAEPRGTADVAWWVEARPWTCAGEAAPFARAIALACDAAGSCRVASATAEAQRRAVLVCEGEEWILRAEDGQGAALWSLALGAGPKEARLRKAAVWIARSEEPGRLAGAPVATAGTRDGTAPTEFVPPATPAPPPPPSRVVVGSAENGHVATSTPLAESLAFALMAHAAVPTTTNGVRPGIGSSAFGARGLVLLKARPLFGPLRFGVTGSFERTPTESAGGYSLGRAGFALGWGAPFDTAVFGILVEGGPGFLWLHAQDDPRRSGQPAPAVPPLLYGQASVLVQSSPRGPLRPFAAVSFAATSQVGPVIPNGYLGLDLGLGWGP